MIFFDFKSNISWIVCMHEQMQMYASAVDALDERELT